MCVSIVYLLKRLRIKFYHGNNNYIDKPFPMSQSSWKQSKVTETFAKNNHSKLFSISALIISFLVQLLSMALLINAKPFLLLIGQIPDIVE